MQPSERRTRPLGGHRRLLPDWPKMERLGVGVLYLTRDSEPVLRTDSKFSCATGFAARTGRPDSDDGAVLLRRPTWKPCLLVVAYEWRKFGRTVEEDPTYCFPGFARWRVSRSTHRMSWKLKGFRDVFVCTACFCKNTDPLKKFRTNPRDQPRR